MVALLQTGRLVEMLVEILLSTLMVQEQHAWEMEGKVRHRQMNGLALELVGQVGVAVVINWDLMGQRV
jgi:hypothetical protein